MEPDGIPEMSPSQSFLQESPQVPSAKEEPFSYSCRFDRYVHLTNLSGAEIALRPLRRTSSAKMVSRKKVWRQSFQNCTSGMPVEQRSYSDIWWNGGELGQSYEIYYVGFEHPDPSFLGGMGSTLMLPA